MPMEALPSLIVVRHCQALRTHRDARKAALKQLLELATRAPEEAELARRYRMQVPCRPTESKARTDSMELGWRRCAPGETLVR